VDALDATRNRLPSPFLYSSPFLHFSSRFPLVLLSWLKNPSLIWEQLLLVGVSHPGSVEVMWHVPAERGAWGGAWAGHGVRPSFKLT